MLVQLARDQEATRDVQLLVFRVAGERDHLHAVEQRRVQRAQLICRGDEQHP
jgi:hypothetical protein